MKSLILTFAAAFCFIASASAQNEVPGQPAPRNSSVDENVHAPVRMDRQAGTETQQQQYDPTDPQHKPEPGTVANPAHHDHKTSPGDKHNHPHIDNSGTKPTPAGNVNRKASKK